MGDLDLEEDYVSLMSPPYQQGVQDPPLTLCRKHRYPNVCTNDKCDMLHMCRLYLNKPCPRKIDCPWGHQVITPKNAAAVQRHQEDHPSDAGRMCCAVRRAG